MVVEGDAVVSALVRISGGKAAERLATGVGCGVRSVQKRINIWESLREPQTGESGVQEK